MGQYMGLSISFDHSYLNLPDKMYQKVKPTPVESPQWVVFNQSLAKELELDDLSLGSDQGLELLAGNHIPDGCQSIAQAYAGHQFGHFTMLGDGRAILLGEQQTAKGGRCDIQLKGAGKTPYSRGGDGRATLGPMLREYLISEAMHALGVPTNRSLAVVMTGETVMREKPLPGAILTRVAVSHIRVGTFQYVRQYGTTDDLRILADYTIDRHFPEIKQQTNIYLEMFKQIVTRQAHLIVKWDLLGFVHGVMNTDNMTVSGETIDYGPCAFIDVYDPAIVFSSIDQHGRYAYNQQKRVAVWNLARLAEALLPLIEIESDDAIKDLEAILHKFSEDYQDAWSKGMRAKLGLFTQQAGDDKLIKDLLTLMTTFKADYTDTFRALTLSDFNSQQWFVLDDFKQWYHRWQERVQYQTQSLEQIKQHMKKHNPSVIPRNFRVEQALNAAVEEQDFLPFNKLLNVLLNPYAYTDEQKIYVELPPITGQAYRTYCGT
ncbi:protein adenylyltransferase SelO [Amphibacillus jilinensis]|uniref:protein adenylyltransferase SelO n=1 Tax=Amphibacillus jilinensis TaxID=1216008 RepID=UPI0003159CAF|nr:YdiU family protein [Amphibacillus jilinensis]